MATSKDYQQSSTDVDTGDMIRKCAMSSVIKWKRSSLIILIIFIVIFLCLYFAADIHLPDNLIPNKFQNPVGAVRQSYTVWPDFKITQSIDSNYFKTNCVRNVNYSITGLVQMQNQWAVTKNSNCRELYDKFKSIFTLEGRKATLQLPKLLQAKVFGWLGGKKELFREVFNQDVIHVINEFTHEHTVFNPLRDKRPVSPPKEPEDKYFNDLLKESAASCDFCQFKDLTAEHTFGRVESEHAFSASNVFKLDTLHALLALKKHDPLHWTHEEFLDLFKLVNVWIKKANANYPKARYPGVVWDVLPKCGASQVHPHLHVILDFERHHGVMEAWRRGAQEFNDIHHTNYFSDLVAIYTSLNLTATYGKAVALASLVPKKDHEIVVIAEKPDSDFYTLLFFVLRGLIDDLHKMCFSMGLALPALVEEGKLPAYARVITRGYVTDVRADISSLELYLSTNVNIDPYNTIEVVRNSIRQRNEQLKNS